MATTKKAAKKVAKPKPVPAKAEQTESPKQAHKDKPERPEVAPIAGVLINVLMEDDKYRVTNIAGRPVQVREVAPHKGYYATPLETITMEAGEERLFSRRDGVTLRPTAI